MVKCEKCGEEYPDGAEHVCSPKPEVQAPESRAAETAKPQEEEKEPVEKPKQ